VRVLGKCLAALTIAVSLAGAVPVQGWAAGAPRVGRESGTWVLQGWRVQPEDFADQGLATVTPPGGAPRLLTRGDDSIPAALKAQGWQHVGDPDSRNGYVLDAYQGGSSATTKLFVLTAPNGAQRQLVHRLVPGEQYHNSFAAISPDGRWFVGGEWGTMRRLLVFRMPNRAAPGTQSLPLAGTIRLDRPVRNVQGCAFSSPTTLACSSNDTGSTLFGAPRPLLSVRLGGAVHAGTNRATVARLGSIPVSQACGGKQEVEGIDVRGGRLLVSAVTACTHSVTIFSYRAEVGH